MPDRLPPAPRRFGYYERLTRAQQRIYRQSDAVTSLRLPGATELHPHVAALDAALLSEDRPVVQAVSQALFTALTRAFGVHIDEEGLALRGTFVINPDGVLKTMEIHDNAIARDVKETVRKLKAAQYVASHPGEVCPAKWNDGAQTIKPSLDLVGKI